MAAINWATPLGAINAALVGATATHLSIGGKLRDRLAALGAEYSAKYTPHVDAQKLVAEAQLATAVASWFAALSEPYAAADLAARGAEALAIADQTAKSATPRVAGKRVLAPDSPIPLLDEPTQAGAVASLVLSTLGGDPAVLVRAAEAGSPGNRVEVRCVTVGGVLTLQARLGAGYVESHAVEDKKPINVSASLLLMSAERLSTSQPATSSWAALSGGAGASAAAIAARVVAAQGLPGADAESLKLYETALPKIQGRPVLMFSTPNAYLHVRSLESDLLKAISAAEAWTALATAV